MTEFPVATHAFWRSSLMDDRSAGDGSFSIIVDAGLDADRRVSLLRRTDGSTTATMTPAIAKLPEIARARSAGGLRVALESVGITLHEADDLFYLTESAKVDLLAEITPPRVRQLTSNDVEVFDRFASSATEQDLDDAYVELEHWAVYGSFDGDRVVSAASAYPWGESRLADLGVLTLPEFRGQGHARSVIRALARHALGEGYEPQYRCQLDNAASIALARAAGLTLFGTWEVVSPDSVA